MKNTHSKQSSDKEAYSFTIYAKETINDYLQRDQFGKQLIRFQIQEEIKNYQNLIKVFDEMDE